jgi:hypothetical protein
VFWVESRQKLTEEGVMTYRVIQHGNELHIRKNYRFTALMGLVFGVFLCFAAVIIRAKLATTPAISGGWAMLDGVLILMGALCLLGGVVGYFIERHVVFNYDTDTMSLFFPLRKRTVPFKAIEALVVTKKRRPSSRHLDNTLGVHQVNYWEVEVVSESGLIPVIELFNELDVKRFLTEMNRGAAWPIEHVTVDDIPQE